MTLNLWSAEGPLPQRLDLIAAAINDLQPDVVALQEVRDLPGRVPNTANTLANRCGLRCAFASASIPGADGDWGLAILSRSAILSQSAFDLPDAEPGERRILLSAQVETPAGPAWIHNTHLNYKLHDGAQRERQVQVIHAAVSARTAPGIECPQILMGDFNARPESDEIRWLRGQITLAGQRVFYQDAWAQTHPDSAGWTWAAHNPYVLRFLDPNRRIDYIFVTPERRDGRGRILDCRMILDQPDDSGGFASDHFGLLAEIQLDPT